MNKHTALQKAAALLRESGATVEELRNVMEPSGSGSKAVSSGHIHLSDWMFFAGGAVLFFALQFAIVLAFPDLSIMRMLLSVMAAIALWVPAVIVTRRMGVSMLAGGISRALLLAGSWSWCMVSLYAVDALKSEYSMSPSMVLYVLMAGFLAVGVLHVGYSKATQSVFALGMAVLALWAAIICLVVGTLQLDGVVHTVLIYQAATIFLSVILPVIAYGVTWQQGYRDFREGFVVMGQFLALSAIFVFTFFPENYALWHLAMIVTLVLLFYRGVSRKKRASFIVAAIFLVISIIAFSFRYFISGGVAVSLFISAIAVFGVATALTLVHKSTFRQ